MIAYGSVCSGIEAASVAWHPLGWRCAFVSEIEAFPSAVLAARWPDVPNMGDMTAHKGWQHEPIDVLVGGTPCQSFSVAGLRKGLGDPRGNLALVYLAMVDRMRPRWVVWENVPGVLSSGGGRDFGTFLGAMGQLGYGWAYRVLDAKYFGVAQRRRRVFVVGHLGDWRRAAAVLFERASLRGDSAPSREAGEGVAGSLAARTKGGGGLRTDFDCDGGLIPSRAMCLNAGAMGRIDAESETLLPVAHSLHASGFDAGEDGTGRGTPIVPVAATLVGNGDAHSGYRDEKGLVLIAFEPGVMSRDGGHVYGNISGTLRKEPGDNRMAVAFPWQQGGSMGFHTSDECSGSLVKNQTMGVMTSAAVRRLTPRECERLQGFPDDYTAIQYRNRPACDGPRYKALGNSMAVPVMRWIGQRIQMVEELKP